MARPGLMRHRKFLRLAMLVGGPAAARGHLELLWDAAYECGEASVGDATDVELVAGWTGVSGVLFNALLTCGGDGPGFIEETGTPNRYQVHDLFHHAPDYVRKRWLREAARRQQRDSVQTASGHCPVSDRTRSGHGADNGRTPAPKIQKRQDTTEEKKCGAAVAAPAALSTPAHDHQPGELKLIGEDARHANGSEFERWWEFYTKKTGRGTEKAQTRSAYDRLPLTDRLELYDRTLAWFAKRESMYDSGVFVPAAPDPKRYLKNRRWEDELSAPTKGRQRDMTGAVVPQSTEHAEDSIEVDPEGVRRFVRLWRSTATGEVVRRRWGKPTEQQGTKA